MEKYDFSGWATKNDLLCGDGRIIRKDAFKDNDGKKVPLVWGHQHNDPGRVLGHAMLENRDEGVYAYGYFNNTDQGQQAKDLVSHGDITSLSIYANRLKQNGRDVVHGSIKELSLVLAGANPGAYIDFVVAHDEEGEDSLEACYNEPIELCHSDDMTVEEVINTMNEQQKNVLYALIGEALESGDNMNLQHADDMTVEEIIDSMSEEQQDVMYSLIGEALMANGGNDMKHNVFDNEDYYSNDFLSHDDMQAIINDGKRMGSLKESFLAHADDYGIQDIEWLFPDVKNLNTPPEFIKRKMDWVSKVMNGTHHTPFSRIKSMFADIREDEARAKGYIKGNYKKEEVFSLLKRTTVPTTIYKKQKLDRDDMVDITDFDVVSWLKGEMRMLLDEEIARAILVGDGRLASSDDKINENNIRPIWTDEELYSIKKLTEVSSTDTPEFKAKKIIKDVIRSRKDYKGSGNPTLFTTEDFVTDCLLIEDGIGHRLYKTVEELATALRVKEIVTVEPMEGLTRVGEDGETNNLVGIIVNLADYNVGADKGGSINMFEDFDIDYNQQKYLIETRCSGALIKPFSAIILETRVVG